MSLVTPEQYKRYNRTFYLKHQEAEKTRSRLYYQTNRGAVLATAKVYSATHAKERLDKWRKWKYNLSPKDFETLRNAQNNCCALCGESFGTETPHVDHDHFTQRVRGLLHRRCNVKLGPLEDVLFMEQAREYLERAKHEFNNSEGSHPSGVYINPQIGTQR